MISIKGSPSSSSLDKFIVEKVLPKKCSRHSEECCDSIDFSLITSNPRVCKICIKKNNISSKTIFPIKSLLSSYSNTYFNGFPVLKDAGIIDNMKSLRGTIDKATKSYQEFFSNLISAIEDSLVKVQNAQKQKLMQLEDAYKKAFNYYKNACKVDELKSVLLTSQDQNDKELKEFIKSHIQQSETNSRLISTELAEFQSLNSLFSIKSAQQIQQKTIELLSQIDFFQTSDLSQIKMTPSLNSQLTQPSLGDTAITRNKISSLNQPTADGIVKQLNDQKNSLNELEVQELHNQPLTDLNLNPPNTPFTTSQANSKISIVQLHNGRYEGQLKNNLKHGYGKYFYIDGRRYEGEYKEGKAHGQGKFICADGSRYEGTFKDNKVNGQGKYFYADGSTYEGEYKNDKPHGKGKHIDADGSKYEGNYYEGNWNGQGKQYFIDGSRYEGEFKDSELNGQGKLYRADGSRHEGEFKNGKPNGSGKVFDSSGKLIEKGVYKNGKLQKK